MKRTRDAPAIKSARRVLETLEFFADARRPAGVVEVAKMLGYPQSSTSVLLQCLEALGYLAHDPSTRRYVPTPRVAFLGSWIERLVGIQPILDSLRRETGETIIVAQRRGLEVSYVHIVEPTVDVPLKLRTGTRRPLVRTATGRVLLAAMSDDEALRALRTHNALATTDRDRVDTATLLSALAEVRETGFAMTIGTMTAGAGVIAAELRLPSQPPLAIGIGAPAERLVASRPMIVRALADAVVGFASSSPSGRDDGSSPSRM